MMKSSTWHTRTLKPIFLHYSTLRPTTLFQREATLIQKEFRNSQSDMLLVDKQRPKSLSEMDYHKDIAQNLIRMVWSLWNRFNE